MNTVQIAELVGVLLNIAFVVLLIRETKWCWPFGIVGSFVQSFVVYESGYYSEALLYLFYAGIGFYGFAYWSKNAKQSFDIKHISWGNALLLLTGGLLLTLGLGYTMSKTNADKTYYDAFSTIFSIIATFLELYKYLIAWSLWIIINIYTIWLYQLKELNLLSIQMAIFTALSIYGLYSWTKKSKAQAQL